MLPSPPISKTGNARLTASRGFAVVDALSGSTTSAAVQVVDDALGLLLVMLPVAIGVGILKYHLYDIDRIISRTLGYAIVTGLLVGVYAGLVLMATQVFRLHTPVAVAAGALAVAAGTLAAAALFSPVRRRVQRPVDRRFNRAGYDADKTVTAFAGRLQDAVDLDSVRDDLTGVVHQALEPAHLSVWVSRRDLGLVQVLGLDAEKLLDRRAQRGVRGQVRVGRDDQAGFFPRPPDQVLVGEELEQPQAGLAAGLRGAEHVALPALLQVEPGQLESVQGGGDGLEPLPRWAGRRRLGHQQAQSRRGAAADPAAELVQLGHAEPLGVHDHHHRRVRHVDADLDDRGRD